MVIKMILSNFLYLLIAIYSEKMNRQTHLAIFAVVAALGILGVIAVESISMMQQQA